MDEDVSDDTQLLMKCISLALKYYPITNTGNSSNLNALNQSTASLLAFDTFEQRTGSSSFEELTTLHPRYSDTMNAEYYF